MFVETILENEAAVLWYHPEVRIVHHHIKHYINGQQLQELLTKGYELLQEKGAKKWLWDDRNNGTPTIEDGHWKLNDWLPEVASAGWKYWALVIPEMITTQMNIQQYVSECAKTGVMIKIFNDPDEALEWLNKL